MTSFSPFTFKTFKFGSKDKIAFEQRSYTRYLIIHCGVGLDNIRL